MTARKRLAANITTEAHDILTRLAAASGLTVTAYLEVIARQLDGRPVPSIPKAEGNDR